MSAYKVRVGGRNTRVAVHRVHSVDHAALVGYFTPQEAEELGVRLIREAGRVRERVERAARERKAREQVPA